MSTAELYLHIALLRQFRDMAGVIEKDLKLFQCDARTRQLVERYVGLMNQMQNLIPELIEVSNQGRHG